MKEVCFRCHSPATAVLWVMPGYEGGNKGGNNFQMVCRKCFMEICDNGMLTPEEREKQYENNAWLIQDDGTVDYPRKGFWRNAIHCLDCEWVVTVPGQPKPEDPKAVAFVFVQKRGEVGFMLPVCEKCLKKRKSKVHAPLRLNPLQEEGK